MTARLAVLALGLALAACGGSGGGGGGGGPPPPPASSGDTLDPPTTGWVFQASPGMPRSPAGSLTSFAFDFPVGPEAQGAPSVHYVVRPRMALGSILTLKFSIEVSGAPTFQYKFSPDNTCGGEANVSLYMQRQGDDWSGQGEKASYRWFSKDAAILKPGARVLSVGLQVFSWTNVWGQDTDAASFQATMQSPMAIGMTFGGGCFKGHGVNISGGSARFTMQEFGS